MNQVINDGRISLLVTEIFPVQQWHEHGLVMPKIIVYQNTNFPYLAMVQENGERVSKISDNCSQTLSLDRYLLFLRRKGTYIVFGFHFYCLTYLKYAFHTMVLIKNNICSFWFSLLHISVSHISGMHFIKWYL